MLNDFNMYQDIFQLFLLQIFSALLISLGMNDIIFSFEKAIHRKIGFLLNLSFYFIQLSFTIYFMYFALNKHFNILETYSLLLLDLFLCIALYYNTTIPLMKAKEKERNAIYYSI